jgi:putative toxin-antitoxin system antitoxin component (TIGR02293 family)
MEYMTRVQEYLDEAEIGSLTTEMELIPMIRKGFKSSVLTKLRKRTTLSEEHFFDSLGIAKRTAARRKKKHSIRLKPIESELLLRFATVFAAATNVLGNEEKANLWMQTPNRSLSNIAPLNALDTGIGFQQVMDTLKRIEYGVYS